MRWLLLFGLSVACLGLRAESPPAQFNDDDLIVFKPGVFTGDGFPPCDFEHPAEVRGMIGPYHLNSAFYDADFHSVPAPRGPGRYGAILSIETQKGLLEKRCQTIYKPAGGADEANRSLLEHKIYGEVTQPQALAALAETRPDSRRRSNPALGWVQAVDLVWWDRLRSRIGALPKLKYLVSLPPGYEQRAAWPLILFLHGSGERGDDLGTLRGNSVVQQLMAAGLPAILVAPQCPWDDWWMTSSLNRMLDEVMKKYRVDASRVCLTGLSMGGYATWAWGIANPERFAALAPMSGAGDPDGAKRLRGMPIWAFHGGKDSNVTPEESRSMAAAVEAAGGEVKLTIYPDAEHDCWNRSYAEPGLFRWMLAQRRPQK